ncbi:MAG: hypothetical protein WCG77_09840, partial [Actinomycetes bacterium]
MRTEGAVVSLGRWLSGLMRMPVTLVLITCTAAVLWPSPANAAVRMNQCPPASAGGSPIGSLTIGDSVVPIVPVTY